MRINTTNFGEITVEPNQIIQFTEGLLGFEEEKEFVLLNNHDTEEPVPFMWLQATKNPGLAFVVAIPFYFKADYEVNIPDHVVSFLDIKDHTDVGVYSLVKIKDKAEDMTFNLMSPIVINAKNRKGFQVVQHNTQWQIDESFTNKKR